MTSSDRWQRIHRLFAAALERPLAERLAFVRARATEDADVAAEVEALLVRSEELGDFLEPPSDAELEPGRLRAGDRIGGFTLLSELGRGGMGVVWEAQQESPRRAVALKLLSAVALSSEAARRLRREADLLGRLAHPNIAQVYDAGTDEIAGARRPWFAMELVEGVPIDVHAQERGLPVRARVELLARVCDAVQHAHERGVIHRDLKPQNILVTAAGEPKVLDFGVARAGRSEGEADTLRTRTGLLLGTLDYMSPEQLAGDPDGVDARADVYALGVVLHELLLGRRPHDIEGRPLPEAVRILCEDQPSPLSSTDKRLRGDLDTITGTALAKERERRYASAAALAADLRRFLSERPITARPASTIYQLRKFARRNRGLVAGVAAALLFLLVGVIGTTRGMLRAQAAEKHAGERRREVERSADESREIQVFLEGILSSVEPDVAAGQDTTLMRRMLDAAAQRIDGGFSDRPLVEASLRNTLGKSYRSIGLFEAARAHFERAIALARSAGSPAGTGALRTSLGALGSTLRQLGRCGEAEPALREALLLERADPSPRSLASALQNLARCQIELGRFDEAEGLLAEAVRLLEGAPGEAAGDLSLVLEGWGSLEIQRGHNDAAEPLLARALEIDRAARPAPSTRRIGFLNALAMLHWQKRDFDAASRVVRESLAIGRELHPTGHPIVSMILSNLAVLRLQAGDLDEAESACREAIDMARALHLDEQAGYAVTLSTLGLVEEKRGRLGEAEEHLRAAAELERATRTPDDPGLMETLCNLARVLRGSGQLAEAQELGEEALSLSERSAGAEAPITLAIQRELDAIRAAQAAASR